MSKKPDIAKVADEAANAQTRLYTFGAIIELLEGGLLPGASRLYWPSARRILRICKAQQQKELARYDAAVATLRTAK
jgi:hypothetical protein